MACAGDALPSGLSYITTAEFDEALQTYPVRTEISAVGVEGFEDDEYVSLTSYILALGLPYQGTDPNGWTTTTTYDGLGRTLSTYAPGLNQPGVLYAYPQVINGNITAPYSVEMQILDTTANQYRSVWGFYDGLGRMIQTQVHDEDQGKTLVSDSFFNPQGLIARQSLPYYSNSGGGYYLAPSGSQFTETAYDTLGRVISLAQPGGITTTSSYDGLTVTVLDPDGRKVSRTTDGLGRLIQVREYSDDTTVHASTVYSYDIGDRLVGVVDASGNTTGITYDWLGRKTGMQDPDMGDWSYTYDPSGNLSRASGCARRHLEFHL
jgi:YD repeat-containing protein